MSTEPLTIHGWLSANERVLRGELARIRTLLEPGAVPGSPHSSPPDTALTIVVEAFGLSPFERDVLLLLAGAELDPAIARRCDEAGGLTFGLALERLPEPHWSALGPDGPLRRWRLVEPERGPLAASVIRLDERILHTLTGINALDVRLRPILRLRPPEPNPVAAHRAVERRIAVTFGDTEPEAWPAVRLTGNDAEAHEVVAANVAAAAGLSLHVLDAADIPADSAGRAALATLWLREAALLQSVLLVQAGLGPAGRGVMELAAMVGSPLFVAAAGRVALEGPVRDFAVAVPGVAERERLWWLALGDVTEAADALVPALAGQHEVGAGRIARAAAEARDAAAAGEDPAAALIAASRSTAGDELGPLVQRTEPVARWEDLVVPPETAATLRAVAEQVRHRATVYGAWGMGSRGRVGLGITALFAGPSGTGKTLAAEVLAAELGLELYLVDLSAVVSKYIGETEKHLGAVFEAAEAAGAVLLFDEADALFGHRSEVRDSHDRYANLEVSYLLQRMDTYRGLAILTTNQKGLLDRAFQRRLRFVVDFPFPDARHRELIWRGMFPAATPTRRLDHAKLARLNVAGGSIRNIAVNGAFLAAAAGRQSLDEAPRGCGARRARQVRPPAERHADRRLAMRRVELHIDELVVSGPDARAARAVVAAFEAELRGRLEHTNVDRLAAGDRREVRAADAVLPPSATPQRTGAAIAQHVGGALGWW